MSQVEYFKQGNLIILKPNEFEQWLHKILTPIRIPKHNKLKREFAQILYQEGYHRARELMYFLGIRKSWAYKLVKEFKETLR